MTDDKLDELERLANAATPGPWGYENDGTVGGILVRPPVGRLMRHDSPEDAAFIAAAHIAVPALVAEVRRLRRYARHLPSCQLPDHRVNQRGEAVCDCGLGFSEADGV